MVAITWPTTIPQCPILNGFSEQKQINNAVSWLASLAYRMTTTQLAAFNSFYESDLEDGTLPFVWSHPILQEDFYWVFDPKDSPKIDRMTSGTFRITFNLIRLPG